MPSKPEPAIPNPAAVLHGEADILANVLADLADDTAKLVYADWLDERDDLRGSLLRRFVNAFRDGSALPDLSPAPAPWCDLLGLRLLELLHDTPLVHKAPQLLALARPALNYKYEKAPEHSFPAGASRCGGRPDLLPNTEWPEFEGNPLAFLGQFNFEELQISPVARELPATGVLSLFCIYDEDRPLDGFPPNSYRAFYFPNPGALERRAFHSGLSREARLAAHRITFSESQTIPDPTVGRIVRPILKEKEEIAAYDDVHFNMLGDDHLLGHPALLRRASTKTNRHLVTIGDGFGWIDDDVMYFTISEADLKRNRFDRVKMAVRSF